LLPKQSLQSFVWIASPGKNRRVRNDDTVGLVCQTFFESRAQLPRNAYKKHAKLAFASDPPE
jgi:hypothetical protein